MFLVVKLTIWQRWFGWWIGAVQATSHYLNQRWYVLLTHICVTRPQWVNSVQPHFMCTSCTLHSWYILARFPIYYSNLNPTYQLFNNLDEKVSFKLRIHYITLFPCVTHFIMITYYTWHGSDIELAKCTPIARPSRVSYWVNWVHLGENWSCRPICCFLLYTMCHYSDVIMSEISSEITSVSIVWSTVCSGADHRKKSKIHVTGLCEGSPPVTGGFPPERDSNAQNVSIWWRRHAVCQYVHTAVLTIISTIRDKGIYVNKYWRR